MTDDDLLAAVADADRTLSKRNRGDGYYKVTRMEVTWLAYDEEKDGLVPSPSNYLAYTKSLKVDEDGTWDHS